MAKIFIPRLGMRLKLLEDKVFLIRSEYRNESIWQAVTGQKCGYSASGYNSFAKQYYTIPPLEVGMPAGTILTVDRIYIRRGAADFDSITFRMFDSPNKKIVSKSKGGHMKGAIRFWLSLDQFNGTDIEIFEEDPV